MREKKQCHCCGTVIYYDGLCWRCKAEKKYKEILALSDVQIEAQRKQMEENLAALDAQSATWREVDSAIEGFSSLLAYRSDFKGNLAKIALEKQVFQPATLYLDADESVRDALLQILRQPDCEKAGNVQWALSLIGDDVVKDAFFALEQHPLPWREKLHVNPSVYAEAGGWTFDAAGNRQTLVYSTCIAMHEDADSADTAVKIAQKQEGHCAACGGELEDILVLDGRDARLSFLGIDGVLRVPICPWCVCFTEENVIRYELDGTSSYTVEIDPYFKENKMPQKSMDEMCVNRWVLDAKPSGIYRSYGEFEVPTIGGMANWVQDWEYLTCPDCGKKMTYLASIPWSCVSDGMEGTLYIEICTACKVVKVLHQQT